MILVKQGWELMTDIRQVDVTNLIERIGCPTGQPSLFSSGQYAERLRDIGDSRILSHVSVTVDLSTSAEVAMEIMSNDQGLFMWVTQDFLGEERQDGSNHLVFVLPIWAYGIVDPGVYVSNGLKLRNTLVASWFYHLLQVETSCHALKAFGVAGKISGIYPACIRWRIVLTLTIRNWMLYLANREVRSAQLGELLDSIHSYFCNRFPVLFKGE